MCPTQRAFELQKYPTHREITKLFRSTAPALRPREIGPRVLPRTRQSPHGGFAKVAFCNLHLRLAYQKLRHRRQAAPKSYPSLHPARCQASYTPDLLTSLACYPGFGRFAAAVVPRQRSRGQADCSRSGVVTSVHSPMLARRGDFPPMCEYKEHGSAGLDRVSRRLLQSVILGVVKSHC